jgi:hypothetical protein
LPHLWNKINDVLPHLWKLFINLLLKINKFIAYV